MTASPQLLSSRFVSVSLLVIAALSATLLFASDALAESPAPHASHTTMAIFTDHAMEDSQWSALVHELHRSEEHFEPIVPGMAGGLDVLRGRDLEVGVNVDVGLSVVIIGDCTLMPGPRRTVDGALGWVKKVDGQIQPFIHVDCTRLIEMLQPVALGMNRERRNTVVAEALARVIAHEWIHIVTQEARHEKSGVMESQFQLSDLLADDNPIPTRRHGGRDKRRSSGF